MVTIGVRQGQEAQDAAVDARRSQVHIKTGFLEKNAPVGLRLRWQRRWFVLTPAELIYCENMTSSKKSAISVKEITKVQVRLHFNRFQWNEVQYVETVLDLGHLTHPGCSAARL